MDEAPKQRRGLTRQSAFSEAKKEGQFDPSKKKLVLGILMFVVVFDNLGELLMMVCTPFIFMQAPPNATQEQLDGGLGAYAAEAQDMGVATAMQIGPLCFNCGQFLSAILSGYMSKFLGKKGALLVFTFGGGLGFFLTALSQHWGMYAFFAFRFVTGFFGGSNTVVSTAIADISDNVKDQENNMAMVMGPVILLIAVGPLVGQVIKGDDNTRLFWPLYFGLVFEVVAGLVVLILMPNLAPPAEKKEEDDVLSQLNRLEAEEDLKKKTGFQKHVYILWTAMALDSIAGGSMNHLLNVGGVRYPWIYGNFNLVILLFSLCVILATPVTLTLTSKLGYAWTSCVGQLLCSISFFMFAFVCRVREASIGVYMTMFYITPTLNMVSQTNNANILIGLAPIVDRDRWMGYQEALTQLMQGLSPLLLIRFLQDETWGPYPYECDAASGMCITSADMGSQDVFPEGFFFIMCGICSIFSIVPFFLLTKKFSRPAAGEVQDIPKDVQEALNAYEQTGDVTWLPAEQLAEISEKLLKEGKPPPTSVSFGKFQGDKEHLERIQAMSKPDMKFWLSKMPEYKSAWLAGGESREEMRRQMQIEAAQPMWTQEQRQEFLDWFGDWLQFAGYDNPCAAPRQWKALLMNSFPFMLENGAKNPQYLEDPIPTITAFERFLMGHLALNSITQRPSTTLLGSLRPLRFKAAGLL